VAGRLVPDGQHRHGHQDRFRVHPQLQRERRLLLRHAAPDVDQDQPYAAPIPVNVGYRNDTLPDSLKVPTQLERSWYAIPNFNTANYHANRIRIQLRYSGQKHMPMLNRPDPQVQVDVYPKGQGQIDQLEGVFVNGCIDSTFGDTVWFWTGATKAADISSNASVASIKCLDHNPFFEKIGTVHVLNPWPGRTVYAQMGDH